MLLHTPYTMSNFITSNHTIHGGLNASFQAGSRRAVFQINVVFAGSVAVLLKKTCIYQ